MSTSRTSTLLIDPPGHLYWVQRGGLIRWWADGSPNGSSSGELLLEWLEKPGHSAYFLAGQGGGDRSKGGKLAVDYLKTAMVLHSEPGKPAETRYIVKMQGLWKKAYDWANGTGNGQGQRQIPDAPDDQKETTTATIQ
ncbi:MAG: hypothetical protein TREMPRED_004063, partial [Tremellales sp. Tagirdzhanova-0007]